MSEVTPIRPDVPVPKARRSRKERAGRRLRERVSKLETRVGFAVALTLSMARAFQDVSVQIHSKAEAIDGMDGMLGLADLLGGIRDDIHCLFDA
jgi:hypothetical protein